MQQYSNIDTYAMQQYPNIDTYSPHMYPKNVLSILHTTLS